MNTIIAYLLVAAISLGAGWSVRGWKEDSVNLAVTNAAAAIREDAITRESDVASKVEKRLGELNANQTVIDRGIIREVQKPIYQRVCLEPDAVRLLNAAARGEAAPDPAKPAGKVP